MRPHAHVAPAGTSMILRMAAAGLAGLLAGCGALAWAVSVVSNGTDTGALVLASLAMWAAGIATTAFGACGVVFYGIGLAQHCWYGIRDCPPNAANMAEAYQVLIDQGLAKTGGS